MCPRRSEKLVFGFEKGNTLRIEKIQTRLSHLLRNGGLQKGLKKIEWQSWFIPGIKCKNPNYQTLTKKK